MSHDKIINAIPAMTDPMGRHWKQPKREDILVDDTHALMSEADFNKLPDYSRSTPSGVYDGKMWRSGTRDGHWYLCWFGPGPNPKLCYIHSREVILS